MERGMLLVEAVCREVAEEMGSRRPGSNGLICFENTVRFYKKEV